MFVIMVDGLKLFNFFVIGLGLFGINLSVINWVFCEGWGVVIVKIVSFDVLKVVNVMFCYVKLYVMLGEVIGWENIELISDCLFKLWEDEFKCCKDV